MIGNTSKTDQRVLNAQHGSTSCGKTTFAFKLKMLGAEPSYPPCPLASFEGEAPSVTARAISSSQLRLNAVRGIQRKLAFFGGRGDPLKKRTLTHGCAPVPFFFLLPVHSRTIRPSKNIRVTRGKVALNGLDLA
jgi:hypothetical protein